MNYTQLSAAIVSYTENEDDTFATYIPTFIKNAEKRIYRDAQIPYVRKVLTGSTMTSGVSTLSMPADYLKVDSMAIISGGASSYLINKEVDFMRAAYPTSATTGTPQYYAEYSTSSLLLGPTPDSNYSYELHYFYYPESIVTASTTWLGDNWDSLLLYGSLLEAYVFMKGDKDVMDYYKTIYVADLDQLKTFAKRATMDEYRMGTR